MKPISARRLKDLPLRALKSYAHAQGKNAKRLRDEASRLGNKAATAERAETRARVEIAARLADEVGATFVLRSYAPLQVGGGGGDIVKNVVPAGAYLRERMPSP